MNSSNAYMLLLVLISASTFNEPTLCTKAYANAALTEVVKLQLEQPEILSTLLKGGNQGTKLFVHRPY